MAEWAMDVLDLKRGGNAIIASAGGQAFRNDQ